MIKPSTLVKYMRDNRTSSIWQVDYGATYFAAVDRSKLPLPCLYVDVNTSSANNLSINDYMQSFVTNIRIRLVCKSQNDRMGRTGGDVAYNARIELFKMFLDKILDDRFNRTIWVRDDFESYDEGRYIHTFDFSFDGQIDLTYATSITYDDLDEIQVEYNLSDSPEVEKPNLVTIVNTLQD